MLFRNLSFEDIRKLKEIDTFSYLSHPHFTSELPPYLPYSNDPEYIKPQTEADKERIKKAIQAFTQKNT